jgi:hypothetical protein
MNVVSSLSCAPRAHPSPHTPPLPLLFHPPPQAAPRSTAAAASPATKSASTTAAGKACLARSAPGWVEKAPSAGGARKEACATAAPPRKGGLQSLFF